MSDHIERACRKCASLLHHEADCPEEERHKGRVMRAFKVSTIGQKLDALGIDRTDHDAAIHAALDELIKLRALLLTKRKDQNEDDD